GIQFFARHLAQQGTFSAKFDWFYLDYRWRDWLGIRAGRVKVPFGLYNESSDVDAARVPILLPQGTYPTQNRDFLLAQTGVELYGFVPAGDAGAFGYRLYGGTIVFDAPQSRSGPFSVQGTDVPYLVGGRLSWETPLSGLKVMGSLQALRIDFDLDASPELFGPLVAAGTLPSD